MSSIQSRLAIAGVLFIAIFVSGYWLKGIGKPYNVALLTVHKLIGLAALIFLVVTIYQIHQVTPLGAAELIVGVVSGLLFIVTIIVGGLLSTDLTLPAIVPRLHQITPFLTVLSTAVTLYLLLRRQL